MFVSFLCVVTLRNVASTDAFMHHLRRPALQGMHFHLLASAFVIHRHTPIGHEELPRSFVFLFVFLT